MKHFSLIIISLILFSLTACTQNGGQQNNSSKGISYSIKRTDYVKGAYKHFEWILQNDSVKVIEYPMSSDSDSVVCYKALSERQRNKLQSILKTIDLTQMQDRYSDDLVQGEGHSVYDITIENKSKSIYLYYVDVHELKAIDEFLYVVTAGDL